MTVREGLRVWEPVSPDVEELPVSLSYPETMVVRPKTVLSSPAHQGVRRRRQLGAGQQYLPEVSCTLRWHAWCIDADCRKGSSSEGDVDAEGSAILSLVP